MERLLAVTSSIAIAAVFLIATIGIHEEGLFIYPKTALAIFLVVSGVGVAVEAAFQWRNSSSGWHILRTVILLGTTLVFYQAVILLSSTMVSSTVIPTLDSDVGNVSSDLAVVEIPHVLAKSMGTVGPYLSSVIILFLIVEKVLKKNTWRRCL